MFNLFIQISRVFSFETSVIMNKDGNFIDENSKIRLFYPDV